MRDFFKVFGICLGILLCYSLIALFFYWIFSGTIGDRIMYAIGFVLVGMYVLKEVFR